MPIHLTYFVTASCPFRCLHCHYHQELSPDRSRELKHDEVDRLARTVGPLLWLCMTGGEPFLRDDLPAIAASFHQTAKPRHMSVVTSGWMPGRVADQLPEIHRASPSTFLHFNVSIDGLADAHDQIRGIEGSFDRAMETIEIAKSIRGRNLGLGIATTFNSLSQHQMPELIEFVRREIQPDHWDISLVRDTPGDPTLQEVDLEAFFRWKRELERMLHDHSIPYYSYPLARLGLARHLAHNRLIERYQRQPGFQTPCLAGRLSAVLYPAGDVSACEVRDLPMGNVRDHDYDLAALWRSDQARAARRTVERTRCHCDHGCHIVVNLTFSPRHIVPIARAYIGSFRPR